MIIRSKIPFHSESFLVQNHFLVQIIFSIQPGIQILVPTYLVWKIHCGNNAVPGKLPAGQFQCLEKWLAWKNGAPLRPESDVSPPSLSAGLEGSRQILAYPGLVLVCSG